MKNLIKITFLMVTVSMFVACKNAPKGEEAKVSDTAGTVSKAEGKNYTVDTNVSKVMWEGFKPTSSHNGTVGLSSGTVIVNGEAVVGGSFTLDMNTITVLDLEGGKKDYLESHLKGLGDDNADDFFNVKKYPTAKYEITKVTKKEGDPTGNALVYGNLTLRDQTKEVGFKANIDMADGMVRVSTDQFKIDRTQWGIQYNSATFFENLKNKAINNEMGLKINLVAK
ncbi:MAG: YceI family protein [Saprospiraceae bacterium]|nr:YceI family protein [Saprospiraceae bacterium]